MTIGAILREKGGAVVSLPREATVGQAVALLAERRIGAVPVVEDGRVVAAPSAPRARCPPRNKSTASPIGQGPVPQGIGPFHARPVCSLIVAAPDILVMAGARAHEDEPH